MFLLTEAHERNPHNPSYVACGSRYETVDRTIDELIDRAPAEIMDEQREPETRRFIREMLAVLDGEITLSEALDGAEYFNRVCCVPGLGPDRIEHLVLLEFGDRKPVTHLSIVTGVRSPSLDNSRLESLLELGGDIRRAALDDIIENLISTSPVCVSGGDWEQEIQRFACDMLAAVNGKIQVREVLDGATQFNDRQCKPPIPDNLVEQIVASEFLRLRPAPQTPDSKDPLPKSTKASVYYLPKDLTNAADQAERAMLEDEHSEPVFAHGGCYAAVRETRPVTALDMTNHNRHAEIVHLEDVALRERLMASSNFYVPKGSKDWTSDKAPHDIVATITGRAGGRAPTLTGLLHAPTVHADVLRGYGFSPKLYGRVLYQPGYDHRTGLFCTFETGSFPMLPTFAAHEQDKASKRARESFDYLIREPFGEFDFRDYTDKSAAVAALLTALVRPVCGIAPAFLVAAPVQASGKTTLMTLVASIVEGRSPALNSWPEKEEELEKVLLSVLLMGASVICFDNLRNGLSVKSPGLAKLLSTGLVQGRILGQSTMATLPASVLVLLSGNNVVLEGDMPSRVIEIYLDARTERPDQRTYRRDVLAWARDNRPDIVGHALTIIKAYLDVGAPDTGGKRTRFPEWDRMVRRPIMWAGGADIATKFDRAYESDPLSEMYREIVRAWPSLGSDPMTAGEIVHALETMEFDLTRAKLRTALRDLMGVPAGKQMSPQALGLKLRGFANRPIDGLRIVCRHDSHGKQNRWLVEAVGE
jgi:hypothetical protein